MAHWTSHYFRSLYHEIYSGYLLNADRALEEASFASHVLDLGRRNVLDMAAGYGRHARLLATSNNVVALDNNADYLGQVKAGVSDRVGARLLPVNGDMRRVPLRANSMDAVICLFNSFGYFDADDEIRIGEEASAGPGGQVWRLPNVFYERNLVDSSFGRFRDPEPAPANTEQGGAVTVDDSENMEVLREMNRVLKPGGGLLMEIPNRRALLEAVEENPRRLVVMDEYEIHEQYEWQPQVRRLVNTTRFKKGDTEESAAYSLRLFEPAELKEMLKSAGFIVRRMYGDYRGDRYRPAESDIILFHATKRAR